MTTDDIIIVAGIGFVIGYLFGRFHSYLRNIKP